MKAHSLKLFTVLALITTLLIGAGCGFHKAWNLDYGDPVAQFYATDVETKAAAYKGKQITVCGKVERVDVSDKENAWVYLEGGIACNFGHLWKMAESYEGKEKVYVDGYLKNIQPGKIVLDPAVGRDERAPFSPK